MYPQDPYSNYSDPHSKPPKLKAYLDVDELTRDMPDTLWYGQAGPCGGGGGLVRKPQGLGFRVKGFSV